jgi:hypothetical protein
MQQSFQNRWKALLFVCVSLLVISLDNTVLNVALPSIANARYLDAISTAALRGIPAGMMDRLRAGLQSALVAASEADIAIAEQITTASSSAFVDGMTHALMICAIALAISAVMAAGLLPARVRQAQSDDRTERPLSLEGISE